MHEVINCEVKLYKPARVQVQWQPSAVQILYQDTAANFLEQTDQADLVGLCIC